MTLSDVTSPLAGHRTLAGSSARSLGAYDTPPAAPWSGSQIAALAGGLLLGIAVRVVLLPTQGLRADSDQFVGWVHHIATNGLGTLYGPTAAGPVTFGPVMGYIWAILAAVDPAFATATDASDSGIRALMKVPASLADIGIALLVVFALRARPTWAVLGAVAILLHPAVIDVAAWGQYESIYLLFALAAAVLAVHQRPGWAAAALCVALMTKPQTLPMLVPFAAWFWATGGWRGFLRAVGIGVAVTVILWLPFLAAGGPLGYLRNLAEYQGGIYAIASLRAWNLWWLFQEAAAGGGFIADGQAFLGPVTLRQIGLALAGVFELFVGLVVFRDPRPRTLVLALAASVLVAFSFLTTMHERYAYGAVIFLILLIAEPRLRLVSLALAVVFTLNLLAVLPPSPAFGALVPVRGPLSIIGSTAMLAITFGLLQLLAGGRLATSSEVRHRERHDDDGGDDGYRQGQ